MKTILTKLTVMSVVLFSALIQAQVGVGTTTPQGALDVSSSDSGMLVPRVSLTSVLVAAPVLNPQGGGLATGTLVYNTATAGVSPNNVVPGFYYWDGTRWVSISGGSVAAPTNAWELTGNAGTDSNVNFIGTTDAQDFVIRANGSSKFRIAHGTNQILSTQNGAISSPTYSWEAAPNYGFYMAAGTNIRVATNGVNRLQFPNAAQIHAMADGTALLPFYSWT
ncbi:MAG TPA: hypothetical protein VLZ72_10350, partial [Flavobacterium sp.]|nr:hypothetical protein [Flavobacterium sp.]